jgi:hypothetical protein
MKCRSSVVANMNRTEKFLLLELCGALAPAGHIVAVNGGGRLRIDAAKEMAIHGVLVMLRHPQKNGLYLALARDLKAVKEQGYEHLLEWEIKQVSGSCIKRGPV